MITGSGAVYLPGASNTSYTRSKAAVCRYAETLNNELDDPGVRVQPGARPDGDDRAAFPDDAPWTPPELAPELVRKLATGRYDALAGRYIHAEHDDVDDLLARIDEIREQRPERDPPAALMRTLVCFGDSNTWGYVPGSDGERFPREVRWPGRLRRRSATRSR